MPIRPTYPGVYVEELPPQGPRTLTGVSTSVTAFVGYTAKGPLDKPKKIFNFGEFERHFGGLHEDSELSYGVRQFFVNGGGEAWIVRVASGASLAQATIGNLDGQPVLEIEARSQGKWGNDLQVVIDYDTANPQATFNLTVTHVEHSAADGSVRVVARETFRNLDMNEYSSTYAVDVINHGSELVSVRRPEGALDLLTEVGVSRSGPLSDADVAGLSTTKRKIRVSLDGAPPQLIDVLNGTTAIPGNLAELAHSIHDSILATLGKNVTVGVIEEGGQSYLELRADEEAPHQRSSIVVTRATEGDAAKLLKLGVGNGGTEIPAAAVLRPAPCGTIGQPSVEGGVFGGKSTTAKFHLGDSFTSNPIVWNIPEPSSNDWEGAAAGLQQLLRDGGGYFEGATVSLVGGSIVVRASAAHPDGRIELEDEEADGLGARLGLVGADAVVSPACYRLGRHLTTAEGALLETAPGSDGSPPQSAAEIVGSQNAKTGLHALDEVEDVNILAIPRMAKMPAEQAQAIAAAALAWCKDRRAFFLLDPPLNLTTKEDVAAWWADVEKSDSGATFVPAVKVPDPLAGFRLRAIAPSGTMAGLFARTDTERGVWKAAAGTDARLANVQELRTVFTDAENGFLNQMGVNVLRDFKVYGKVAWGARSLAGDDKIASPWKYISVRRLALYIEESLRQGLQWVVFEPNDEPLWARIRATVEGFMQGLFRKGAFQGQKASEAFLVKVDRETTTQQDIDNGIVNILVGFAPLKPAEFVIIQLQQLAGQNPV